MTDQTPTAIPVEAHPDPVAAYRLSNGRALITATNEHFEALFDTASPPATVTDALNGDRVVDSAPPVDLRSSFRRDDPTSVRIEGDGERGDVLARIIPTDDEHGVVVFTPLDDRDGAGTPDIGHIASVISHDLRNPLDVAKAHLRAARETGKDKHFDAVDSAHDRMERIIRDVLALAREPESASTSESVDIETVANEAWGSVTTDRATLTAAESLPTVTADRDQLRRVFENLFRNSIEQGAVQRDEQDPAPVTVTVGPLEDGFFVSDDGPGVPVDEQAAVFRPGYSTKDRGTGLGLAIVDRIVSAHGWDVTLTTGADGGARFEVRI